MKVSPTTPTTKPQHDGKDLLVFDDVQRLTTLNKQTLYRYARTGKMPAPIKLGAQFFWYESDILTWVKNPTIKNKIALAQYMSAFRPASNDEHYSEGSNV
jgi:predicted DNA-binding transcriptional regulator AlpA